jgi:hypothetical protein
MTKKVLSISPRMLAEIKGRTTGQKEASDG